VDLDAPTEIALKRNPVIGPVRPMTLLHASLCAFLRGLGLLLIFIIVSFAVELLFSGSLTDD
jgi:hypothetical protein